MHTAAGVLALTHAFPGGDRTGALIAIVAPMVEPSEGSTRVSVPLRDRAIASEAAVAACACTATGVDTDGNRVDGTEVHRGTDCTVHRGTGAIKGADASDGADELRGTDVSIPGGASAFASDE